MVKAIMSFNSCDLLKNIYLCGSNNNTTDAEYNKEIVVICLKISIFVVATTTSPLKRRVID